jgi:hypothetical protein
MNSESTVNKTIKDRIDCDKEARISRALHGLRAVSALAFSENNGGEALLVKREDLSDLLMILCDELMESTGREEESEFYYLKRPRFSNPS